MKIVVEMKISSSNSLTFYYRIDPGRFPSRWFWQVVEEMSPEKQRRLLLFVTGSDRMPIGGLSEMTFKIGRVASKSCNVNEL